MPYNLVYISQGTFWKNAKMKTFEHQDVLFKKINEIIPLEVHIGLPMYGDTYLRRLIYDNNDKMVMKTWRNYIPYKIYDGFYEGDKDCVFINGCETFNEVLTPKGIKYSNEDMFNYIIEICNECKDNNKPIILYDPDDFIHQNFLQNQSISRIIYDNYKNYNKFYLMGPFYKGIESECKNDYVFVPFGLDPDIVSSEIKPKSERNYIVKYVGNNYFRENFVPYFIEASKYGKVKVNGHHWTKIARDNSKFENLEFGRAFPLTVDNTVDYLSDSIIGLYGTFKKESYNVNRERGHFCLRIREFYQAGLFIIPEDLDYLKETVSIDNITTSNISSFNFNMSDTEYRILVKRQREKLLKTFDITKYAKYIVENIL